MQSLYKSTVSDSGAIAIPSKIRKALNLKAGDRVCVVLDDELKIIPMRAAMKDLQAIVKQHSKNDISLVDSLFKSRKEDLENE